MSSLEDTIMPAVEVACIWVMSYFTQSPNSEKSDLQFEAWKQVFVQRDFESIWLISRERPVYRFKKLDFTAHGIMYSRLSLNLYLVAKNQAMHTFHNKARKNVMVDVESHGAALTVGPPVWYFTLQRPIGPVKFCSYKFSILLNSRCSESWRKRYQHRRHFTSAYHKTTAGYSNSIRW